MFRQPTFDRDRLIKALATAARRRFKDISLCGQGGHAYTFQARDSRYRDRLVAIKVAKHDVDGDKRGVETDIINEGMKAALLSPHKNIVQVYELVEFDQGKRGLVMEFIQGGSLRQAIPTLRGEIARSVSIAVGVCSALVRAHEWDPPFVHRDVKPENILMDQQGVPKLVDFGIALEASTVAEAVGSLNYMAPEYLTDDGHAADPRSDLYSLNVVLFEMLEGTPPFHATNTTDVMNRIKRDRAPDLNEGCPIALRGIVRKGLQKKPSDRYQSAREMLFDLEQFLLFYKDLWVAIDKFEVGLHCDNDPEQNAKKFVFLGERYLELATDTFHSCIRDLPTGPHRTQMEHRLALLSIATDEYRQPEELLERVRGFCRASDRGADHTANTAQQESPGTSPPGHSSAPIPPTSTGTEDLDKEIGDIDKLLQERAFEAAKLRAQALLSSATAVITHHRVADLFYRFGFSNHAIAICHAALKERGEHPDLHAVCGKALMQAGRNSEALQALRKAVELGTSDIETRDLLDDFGQLGDG